MSTKPFVDDGLSVAYFIFSHVTNEPVSVTIEPFNMKLSYYTPHQLGVGCFLHYMRLEHTRLHRGVDIIINSSFNRDNFTLRKALNDMAFFSENNCRNMSSDVALQLYLGEDAYFTLRCYRLRMGRFINSNFGAIRRMINEIGFTLHGYCLLSHTNFNKTKVITKRDYAP
jgi:hypothetical protein